MKISSFFSPARNITKLINALWNNQAINAYHIDVGSGQTSIEIPIVIFGLNILTLMAVWGRGSYNNGDTVAFYQGFYAYAPVVVPFFRQTGVGGPLIGVSNESTGNFKVISNSGSPASIGWIAIGLRDEGAVAS